MPLEYPSSEYVQYTHFRGCIRKIYDNLEMYDLGYPLKVVDAPVGCSRSKLNIFVVSGKKVFV